MVLRSDPRYAHLRAETKASLCVSTEQHTARYRGRGEGGCINYNES